MAAYSPTHATGWNLASTGWTGNGVADILATPMATAAAQQRGPRRLLKMTLEDRIRLHAEVINARRALANANILRKPEIEVSTGWKSTLRRFGRMKNKKVGAQSFEDDYSNDEVLRNYPRAFWAYIKEPLCSSLLVISDPDLEGAAVTMFEQILSYSGLRRYVE